MLATDLEVVRAYVGAEGERIDVVALTEDDESYAERSRLMAPDAVITFPSPDGGFIGAMAGPFEGPEGMREGWREWLDAWRRFEIEIESLERAGEGRVLLLAQAIAETGSGAEMTTGVAAVYEVRDGVITRIEHFLDQAQGRRAAGVD